jgi:LCP family protein required for cell wall assembly
MEMNAFRKVLIAIGILVFLGGAIYVGYNLPLGPRLKTTQPPAPTLQPSPTSMTAPTATSEPAPAVAADIQKAGPVLPTQARGICGTTGVIKVLLLGENLPETPRRGADAIRLMRVDYDQKRVDILALPPDLWVQTPVLAGIGVDATTLTLVYYDGKQITPPNAERPKMIRATYYFAETLADNFGYVPDHYITIKESIFRDLVNTMGGLKINIPEPLDATSEGFGTFTAGDQVLNGQRVLDYVRFTAPNEWARMSRQNLVLSALSAQLTSPQIITKIPGVITQFYSNIITDFSVKQLFSLNCLLGSSGVTITISQLGADLVTAGEGGVLIPKMPEVSQFILDKVGP